MCMTPLVITGMHRSGTSYVTSLFARRGLDVGKDQLPASPTNPRGYFEDADFVALHGEMLTQACPDDGGGWPDWGWVPEGTRLSPPHAMFAARGRALINQRSGQALWGWKDPRTSLLLDFWKELAPAMRCVFVFRAPWDVADSMRRLGDHPPLNDFDTAIAIWTFYNQHLLDFHSREPERCTFMALEAAAQLGQTAVTMALEKWGVVLPEPPDQPVVFESQLLTTRNVDRVFLDDFARRFPEAWLLWQKLNHIAAEAMPVPQARQAPAPRVAVVVPCRNHGAFLLESLPTILANHEVETETIIVNDGSTSAFTLALLHRLESCGWRVLHQEPSGLAAARNTAIRASRAEFILPLDADNQLTPTGISDCLRGFEENPTAGVVYSDVEYFGERTEVGQLPDWDEARMHVFNYIDACALFRRTAWELAGGYDGDFNSYEDWDFWLSLHALGIRFYHLNKVTFRYRVRGDSMVNETANAEGHGNLCRKLAEKHAYYTEHYPHVIGRLHTVWRDLDLAFRRAKRQTDQSVPVVDCSVKKTEDAVDNEVRALEAACAENAQLMWSLEVSRNESIKRRLALREAQQELAVIQSTLAWRFITPLRAIESTARRFKRSLMQRVNGGVSDADAKILKDSRILDVNWYCARHPEEHIQPDKAIAHYLRFGLSRGWEPNRMFDTTWYLAEYPDVKTTGLHPVLHYASTGWMEGRNPHPLFDVTWYLGAYRDVEDAGCEPLVHYLQYGWKEGRQTNALAEPAPDAHTIETIRPWFDTPSYCAKYPDVVRSEMDPVEHYHFIGEQLGYQPCEEFDPSYYASAHAELRLSSHRNVPLFFHFVTSGKIEGRSGRAFIDPIQLRDGVPDADIPGERVGVAIHIFYPSIWPDIRVLLDRLPRNARLYVSLVKGHSDHLADEIMRDYPTAWIDVAGNRGRDIAPFMKQLRAMQADGVVAALKIHGKKTSSAVHNYGDEWRQSLYEDLAPDTNNVNAIIDLLLTDPTAGIVIPEAHYASLSRGLATNRPELFRLSAALGQPLTSDSLRTTPFPVGSMFWFRPAALAGFTRLNLTLEDYPEEAGQTDGTIAHAIERLFCVAAAADGFTTKTYAGKVRLAPAGHTPSIGTMDTSRRTRLEKKYPGITSPEGVGRMEHVAFASRQPLISFERAAARPRLNFLFQSLDPDIVYGGYIAGLEFAAAMEPHVDIRFIPVHYPSADLHALRDLFAGNSRVGPMLQRAQLANLCTASDVLPISENDFFCAFSSWDCLLASKLAHTCGQSGFLYFCQEDEACFHPHDARHAIVVHAQHLPQFTLFNSSLLRDHFRVNRIGLFARDAAYAEANSVSFEHALTPAAPASLEEYRSRSCTRILVYARPEDHARRNLFEFALIALREFLHAVRPAADEVEIIGVGTLTYEATLSLGDGHVIRIIPKMAQKNYAESLAGFDIGLSLMYAPHPGVMHFEMASAGMLVVTNTFGVRTRERLAAISSNLIPVAPTVDGITAGLHEAWNRRHHIEARIQGSAVTSNRSWEKAFEGRCMEMIQAKITQWLKESALHRATQKNG